MPVIFEQVVACVEVAIKGVDSTGLSEMFNVLNFQTPSAIPNAGDVEACVSLVDNWVSTVYKLLYSEDITVIELRGKSRYASAAPFFNLSVAYGGQQGGLDELAQAPLILLHGPLSSRHEAGRAYTFPPGSDQPQQGYTLLQLNNLVNAFINLKVSAASNGYQLAVASPELHTCVAVSSISHSSRLTYQKRRRLGFGR